MTVFWLAQTALALRASATLALQFSLLLFSVSAISDLIMRSVLLRSDPIYNVRRCAGLSMFSLLLWFGFLFGGSLLAFIFVSWSFWVDLFLVGFAAVCILRLIVFSSTSFASFWGVVGASLLQPAVCLLPMFYVPYSVGYPLGTATFVIFLFLIPLTISTAFFFIHFVNKVGIETLKMPTTTVLKAFLANWMENLNAPVETLFENFGKEKDIDFSLLAFKAEKNVKSLIVVSSFHPGPFRNVGSSFLPFMIQEALEEKMGCIVAVPHGLFGHEFDLSSQTQNRKVLDVMFDSAAFAEFVSKATRFVRVRNDVASASCQIFGSCAFLTLTLAPETTEDFPKEVGDLILERASRLGLEKVIIINAHNSIDSASDMSRVVEPLKQAALDALKEASKQRPSPFEVGAARVVCREFSLEDGMGLGGICALVVRVGNQTCVYITIDGNNMVSGLREKILDALRDLGVDAGEVLTTDTHAVNGIVKTTRGYYPVGEAIPHGKLIKHIKRATREALNNMKPASVAWRSDRVTNVRVIGEKQISEMSLLADDALKRAKKTAIPLFTTAGLLLLGLLIAF